MTVLDVAGVLLDMDGTLVDSTGMVDQVWGDFAREVGLDPAVVLAHVHGVPARATLRRFLGDDADIEPWFARISAWENERFDAEVEVPGAVAAVRTIPPARWAVVTSAVRTAALRRMERLGFPEVSRMVAAEDVERGKPDPEPYRRGAGLLGAAAGECVVFEDADAGVRSALAAGATVVVVGGLATPATEGLARVADMREVSFGAGPLGVRVTLGPRR
ncbi:HAD-IA family hydrolase [Demequina lignilytica]|uniref:HAD-IA family hydrolase n=1 Tax=Demequina lignilytica TaxID=3051663 RepID=A0AB35MEI0_9MICO|nr:HAD-IA family hydrolase [Demequina sp. SYSU T0a273]MDN4482188.1 HAD-IA family hydrolase [Demequina sp. SYSU T0a273]